MIVDIIQEICLFSGIRDQIKLLEVNKDTNTNLYIYNISKPVAKCRITPIQTIDEDPIYRKISQKIIMQKKFSKLKSLYISRYNNNILNLDHLQETLVELFCYANCINNNCVSKLHKLRVLYATNPLIFNYDVLSDTLEKLNTGDLTQHQIEKLTKLTSIEIRSAHRITSFEHFKFLKTLRCPMSYHIR